VPPPLAWIHDQRSPVPFPKRHAAFTPAPGRTGAWLLPVSGRTCRPIIAQCGVGDNPMRCRSEQSKCASGSAGRRKPSRSPALSLFATLRSWPGGGVQSHAVAAEPCHFLDTTSPEIVRAICRNQHALGPSRQRPMGACPTFFRIRFLRRDRIFTTSGMLGIDSPFGRRRLPFPYPFAAWILPAHSRTSVLATPTAESSRAGKVQGESRQSS